MLDPGERVVELARMLAGHEDSAAARQHAAELLADAGQTAPQPAAERPGA